MAASTFILKAKDGTALQGKSWVPEGPMVTVICLVHGLGEHIGRYGKLADFMNSRNIGVVGIDLRGHGRSDGKRGHIQSYGHLLDDVQSLMAYIKSAHPGIPMVLYGHSLGGNIAVNYLLRRDINGLMAGVISSPWLRLAFEPPAFKVKLAKLMRGIYPAFTEGNEVDPNDLSNDPAVCRAYANDPLVHSKITAGMFFSAFEAGNWALEHANELNVKTLVMHGTEDKLTAAGSSREFVNKSGGMAIFQSWEGMKHEPHNDPGDDVAEFVAGWIHELVKRRAADTVENSMH